MKIGSDPQMVYGLFLKDASPFSNILQRSKPAFEDSESFI